MNGFAAKSARLCRQIAVNTSPQAAIRGTPMNAPANDDVANGATQNTMPQTTGTVSIHLKIRRVGLSLRLRQRTKNQPMKPRAITSSTIPRTMW